MSSAIVMDRDVKAVGLLLAAGEGRRMGRPKALVTGADGTPWIVSAAGALKAGNCDHVFVTVGAGGPAVRDILANHAYSVLDVEDWAAGMSASLRVGLEAVKLTAAEVCLVHLVDLPDVGSSVVSRVLTAAPRGGLARATFGGQPGHPVAISREHWTPLLDTLEGDEGARAYLEGRHVEPVECGDLAIGADVDYREN